MVKQSFFYPKIILQFCEVRWSGGGGAARTRHYFQGMVIPACIGFLGGIRIQLIISENLGYWYLELKHETKCYFYVKENIVYKNRVF